MLIASFSLWAIMLGAAAEPAKGAGCADVIGIEGSIKDQRDLRALLRRGSLSKLHSDGCRDYQVRVIRNSNQGWTVSMTSRSSTRKFEREVTQLTYAATWVEAWSQSGFTPASDDPKSEAGVSVAAPAPAAPLHQFPAVPPASAVLLSVEPLVAVTSRGYGLAGASILAGHPARRTPWFGIDLGFASQLGADGSDYRRAYWAGPTVGGGFALSDRWHLRPAVSLGVMGAAVSVSTQTATGASLYAGLSCEIEVDLTTHLALSTGLDARLLFENLAGSNAAIVSTDDDTTVVSKPSSSLGQVWAALRLGVVWHFGGAS